MKSWLISFGLASAFYHPIVCAQNDPISIEIVNPKAGEHLRGHQQFTVEAAVSDLDGFITRVDFLSEETFLGQVFSAPFSLHLQAGQFVAGPHTLSARATDNRGNVTTSSAVPSLVEPYMSKLRAVYLTPTNAVFNPAYFNAIQSALTNLQSFYASQLANGTSFRLNTPIVESYVTPHTAAWYTNNSGGYFYNVLNDGRLLTGATYPDEDFTWVFYVDANAGGQPTGGILGAAVLHQGDLKGLIGQSSQPINRWIGGSGHEIGHAFGLPHPPGCETPVPGQTCPSSALMWLGYIDYPNTYLLPANKQSLSTNAFFYQPATPILLQNARVVSNVFSFEAAIEAGWPYHVLSSFNLKNWTDYYQFLGAATNVHIAVTNPVSPMYYRLQFP